MGETVGNWLPWLRDQARVSFGLELEEQALARLGRFADELLRWNPKVNLTSIVVPAQVVEKHLLDSLAVVGQVPAGSSVIDVGTGAGLPGLPLAVVRPDVTVLLVDRTEKKVTFLKSVTAALGLANVRARAARLEVGDVAGVGSFDVAVSRAFAAPGLWLPLARELVRPGGRILTMLGNEVPAEEERNRLLGEDRLLEEVRFQLPGGDRRAIWVVERAGGPGA